MASPKATLNNWANSKFGPVREAVFCVIRD